MNGHSEGFELNRSFICKAARNCRRNYVLRRLDMCLVGSVDLEVREDGNHVGESNNFFQGFVLTKFKV